MQRYGGWMAAAAGLGGALASGAALSGPLPGDAYDIIEAELIDRRSGTVELWHQEVDRSGADRVGTFGALTTRGTGNWQITVGLGTEGVEDDYARAFLDVEGLWLWRDRHRDGYGLGLAAGADYDISNDQRREHFLLVPLTVDWGQRTTVHANLGVNHDRTADDTDGIWGLGLDWRFTERWDVILQVSGDTESDNDARGAFGVRRSLLDDLVQVDLAYGREMSSGEDDEFYLGVSFDAIRF
ncbi:MULTISPECIES: hypothetical protein [Halorhodospira]|uniref:hypothetical protein n=1 Tax=Halorhodospira TaxID=85108 RepID=UPI001EE79D45|nr:MULTISPECIES: hypothetical protein [Halorhodospira]MCG5528515.1 hypothetical protein [Halorhodospira halophila]MCG5543822.1 hypothetical protein [Halorhodospira sp. 9628]